MRYTCTCASIYDSISASDCALLGPVNAQANMIAQLALVAAKIELVLVLKSLIAYERLAFIDSQYC